MRLPHADDGVQAPAGAVTDLAAALLDGSPQPLVCVAGAQHRRVVEVAADEHHADRQSVRHAARHAEGRVARDVERRRVVQVAERGGETSGIAASAGIGRAFIAVVGITSTSNA